MVHQMKVKRAFLNSELEREKRIYMEQYNKA